ncbi:universal stress protein [Pontibacter sp. SGAir0037]|uniref:universal stress protein n=1 Tax=Pontibacter sp. SGAir0037 TaxID=2571030 RepID=UPI0010CD55BD|nr:universal stress protein [Pontibacter sp. SGAir0037]QCR23329.1 universal stress protein [Pontibacter sp. SGAir0037]
MFRILLPVDFSESSDNACEYALSLTEKVPNAHIVLLHCFYDYLADADNTIPADEEVVASEVITERVLYRNQADAQEQLEQLHQTLLRESRAAGSHVRIEPVFMNGVAEEVITEEVSRFKPDIIIMGTKGETNISRSFFGTVTTQVIEDAKTPVLTVPLHHEVRAISKVLYATNFDQADVNAITTLAELLAPFKPSILCVHISNDGDEDQEKLLKLKDELTATTAAHPIQFALLEGDDVAEALQAFGSKQAVDLIALTTHERSTWNSIFKPSLAKKMVLHTNLPLLIFHSSQTV